MAENDLELKFEEVIATDHKTLAYQWQTCSDCSGSCRYCNSCQNPNNSLGRSICARSLAATDNPLNPCLTQNLKFEDLLVEKSGFNQQPLRKAKTIGQCQYRLKTIPDFDIKNQTDLPIEAKQLIELNQRFIQNQNPSNHLIKIGQELTEKNKETFYHYLETNVCPLSQDHAKFVNQYIDRICPVAKDVDLETKDCQGHNSYNWSLITFIIFLVFVMIFFFYLWQQRYC